MIGAEMRAAALAPRPGRSGDEQGCCRHVADSDARCVTFERSEAVHGLRKTVTVTDHADMRAHRRAQPLHDRGIRCAAARRHQCVGKAGSRGDGAAGDVVGDACGVDHGLQQRIRGEAVGAMRTGGGHFAAGP